MPIPSTVDEVTPAWLSEVLDADVAAVETLDAHSGTTGRAKVRIQTEADLPETLFVKLQPFDADQRAFLEMVGLGVGQRPSCTPRWARSSRCGCRGCGTRPMTRPTAPSSWSWRTSTPRVVGSPPRTTRTWSRWPGRWSTSWPSCTPPTGARSCRGWAHMR